LSIASFASAPELQKKARIVAELFAELLARRQFSAL